MLQPSLGHDHHSSCCKCPPQMGGSCLAISSAPCAAKLESESMWCRCFVRQSTTFASETLKIIQPRFPICSYIFTIQTHISSPFHSFICPSTLFRRMPPALRGAGRTQRPRDLASDAAPGAGAGALYPQSLVYLRVSINLGTQKIDGL